MDRLPTLIVCLGVATASMAANAQAFMSPEAAFEAYEQARVRNDVRGFLATINFHQEALERLQGSGKETAEKDVTDTAAKREADLRKHLETRGFTKYGDCEIARKLRDSDRQVRFILSCADRTGTMLLPVRVMHSPSGWLVVRGG